MIGFILFILVVAGIYFLVFPSHFLYVREKINTFCINLLNKYWYKKEETPEPPVTKKRKYTRKVKK